MELTLDLVPPLLFPLRLIRLAAYVRQCAAHYAHAPRAAIAY